MQIQIFLLYDILSCLKKCYEGLFRNASKKYLTRFMQLVCLYIPWKHQKTKDFLMFSGGIEKDQWNEIP